ncbi:MAG: M1 family aminopeptidase [Candidatus Eisenbacteria bacterium]
MAARAEIDEGEAEGERARKRAQDSYDVLYYRLAIDLRDISSQWILGDLTARLRPVGETRSILLDFDDDMVVDSVWVDGQPAGWNLEQNRLQVQLDFAPTEPFEVRVAYQGHPVAPGINAFGYSVHGPDRSPLIWTLSEPEGARTWWPCKDTPADKADSLDVLLRVPAGMVATSNGLLDETIDHGDGSFTYHWKHRYPIATYLVCVTATNYETIEDRYVPVSGDTLPVVHYVYPEHLEEAREDFSITPEAIEVFQERFGPYPFAREKYGHSIFPWGGGMEHQTNTSYGSSLITGSHLYDWVLVHELAHQWWGDMTSPADWRDIWLNEGFASYGEAIWFEHRNGREGYLSCLQNLERVVDPSGPLYDPPALFDDNTVYNKGAWVLHMLRGVLGDSLFFASLHEYRDRTAYRSTTTAEFQSIVEEVAGQDLDWFFQPWVYGVDRPQYVTSFETIGDEATGRAVSVRIVQTQKTGTFAMPITLRFRLSDGDSLDARVFQDPQHEEFQIPLPEPTDTVRELVLDPDSWILKKVLSSLNITIAQLPVGQAGLPYHARIEASGGRPPYEWEATMPLPEGLTLDPANGLLSGIAPDAGSYAIEIQVSDALGASVRRGFTWRVIEAPQLLALPNPAGKSTAIAVAGFFGQPIRLRIYDTLGRIVRDLWNGTAPAEPIVWDGRDDQGREVGSGLYVARLTAGSREVHRRIVWIR